MCDSVFYFILIACINGLQFPFCKPCRNSNISFQNRCIVVNHESTIQMIHVTSNVSKKIKKNKYAMKNNRNK